ncbi:MAG TPA: hypothetical protein VFM63_05180 [Pyrinomonadaceae bacterium]|nr:hypothetical protein [Pyrinomonadaceae bacterium]
METIGLSDQPLRTSSRWRVLKVAVLICFAIVAIPILFVVVVNNLPARQFASTESPDKTYTVNLRGKKSRSRYMFIAHSVYFDLYRRGDRVVRGQELHYGDFLDDGFEDFYPDHTWLDNSTLMFHNGKMVDQPDTLIVVNEASKPIKFLQIKINSVEQFLLFDLARQARATLSFRRQRDEGWITVEGEFEDGTKVAAAKVTYYVDPNSKEPYKEGISIEDDAVTVRHPWAP